jgi:uridine kinase
MPYTKLTSKTGQQLTNLPFSKGNNIVVGLCGGSGSGKTTILRKLRAEFAHIEPTVVSLDNYYLPFDQQQKDAEGKVNFDLPTALDKDRLIADIQKLMSGHSITLKEYAFNHRNGENVSYITLHPSPLLFIEGLFVLHYDEIRSLLDFSIFVDVDLSIQFDRRLKRDQKSRNYSFEQIHYQWNNHVLPCYEQFLLPYRETSSKIVYNEGDIQITMPDLVGAIRELVE